MNAILSVVLLLLMAAAIFVLKPCLRRRLIAYEETAGARRDLEAADGGFHSQGECCIGSMRGEEALCDRMAALMKERLGRDMNALELACGEGRISERIAGSVRSLEAVDASGETIARAKRRPGSSRLHYSVQEAADLSYADESFDAVIIVDALHILPEPEKAMGEIRRVLKADGLLIAPTPVREERAGFRPRAGTPKLPERQIRWNEEEFVDFVGRQGFEVACSRMLHGGNAALCYLEAFRK